MAIDTDESVAATATQLLLAPTCGCRATFLLLTPTPRSCHAATVDDRYAYAMAFDVLTSSDIGGQRSSLNEGG